ncbi:response regulator [Caenimonas koreensis]|uniref:Virulence sensor protein BvgS n=1 Tax=Caenimonas koreensis DSM 17982 TaxID=1121255 RepID=A0A844AX73_9BURK|nr:response regulator [Caenimonas koreensis]MRD48664.1 response regulator [Caenimonas koreensis DSM 17982]
MKFSLRHILAGSLVFLAVVPTLAVLWMMNRASTQAVQDLAGTILTHVATRVQNDTESHVRQAHDALDGLFPERLSGPELDRARTQLRTPAAFEGMAFALTRQSQDVPVIHIGNLHGEYFGVERNGDNARVGIRKPDGLGRLFYDVRVPGDRSKPLDSEISNFEPRSTPWYSGALTAKDRVFTPVRVSVRRKQLMVSLAQPVFDADGGAAGVFAADLYLQTLADLLRTQRISSHGAAFVVDEKGLLVASSAGDALFTSNEGKLERTGPATSANPMIRAGFTALQQLWATRSADTVATNTALQRLPLGDDAVLMVQRPFGEGLGLHWTLVVAAPESDFTGEITRGLRLSLGAIALVIVLATLVAFAIAHMLGRRLRGLTAAAEQLGRREVPAISRTRIREINQLSTVLHDSAEQLQAYREQVEEDARALQEANDTLEARVERRTAQLAASREEALSAARAKAAFLATMSHEIRTPLNGVVGMSTLLAETPLDAEQRDYLQTIRLSSDQLLAVINDVLDFSKIESGKLDLEIEPVSVRGAVEEACDIAAPRAREKGLELIIDVADHGDNAVPEAIKGDITRLRQVLINLINNAVKFTAQGEVAVHARLLKADDGQGRCVLEFRVTDSGIGIPPERIDSLFQAFTQVDASTTRKYGGTGLGLAICKRLVDLMGGEIGVESEAGKGSTFWFTIAAPRTQLAQTFNVADAGMLDGKRALIVDDHATNVRILARQLQMWGIDVTSASSGQEALAFVDSAPEAAHIVITDMHMPEMDGVALARELRSRAAWRDVPIVLLSSGFMPGADESARLFTARLLKPARQNQLFETLLRCVSPQGPQRVSLGTAGPDAKKDITILVADDNAVNLKVACAMLLKLGYEVRTATDGREAIEAVAQAVAGGTRLGAILMDVNMPEVDGLEATRQIHAIWGAAAPPIIALTAGASAEDRARCEAAGMNEYLTKPLHVAALAQALERWTAGDAPAVARAAAGASAAAPEADAGVQLLDPSRLEEFKEFDDEDLSMTKEVVALFVKDAPLRIDAIEQAIAAGDAGAVAKAAHALKGAASNIGAVAIQSEAAQLEAAASAGDIADAPARAALLRQLWSRTHPLLSALA